MEDGKPFVRFELNKGNQRALHHYDSSGNS